MENQLQGAGRHLWAPALPLVASEWCTNITNVKVYSPRCPPHTPARHTVSPAFLTHPGEAASQPLVAPHCAKSQAHPEGSCDPMRRKETLGGRKQAWAEWGKPHSHPCRPLLSCAPGPGSTTNLLQDLAQTTPPPCPNLPGPWPQVWPAYVSTGPASSAHLPLWVINILVLFSQQNESC